MKILAKRADGFLYVAPFVIVTTLVYCANRFNTCYNPDQILYSLYDIFFGERGVFVYSLVVNVIFLIKWIERFLTPKVMIEYDNAGLYIYKYKFSTPVTLRYEAVYSALGDEDLDEIYVRRGRYVFAPRVRISNPTWGLSKTGTLRIEIPTGFITLHGVKNVNQVRFEITKLVREFKKEQKEFIDANIERARAQNEDEEQKKHDPNT